MFYIGKAYKIERDLQKQVRMRPTCTLVHLYTPVSAAAPQVYNGVKLNYLINVKPKMLIKEW